MESLVKLVGANNSEVSLSKSAFEKSKFLKEKSSAGESNINLPDINQATLNLVKTYLEHYEKENFGQIPQVLKTNNLEAELKDSPWDFKFINDVNFEQAFHLVNAGALLELDHLHDLACAKIAAFMKDKSTEEVNQEFTIECQLTAEEAKNLGLEVDDGKEG